MVLLARFRFLTIVHLCVSVHLGVGKLCQLFKYVCVNAMADETEAD